MTFSLSLSLLLFVPFFSIIDGAREKKKKSTKSLPAKKESLSRFSLPLSHAPSSFFGLCFPHFSTSNTLSLLVKIITTIYPR